MSAKILKKKQTTLIRINGSIITNLYFEIRRHYIHKLVLLHTRQFRDLSAARGKSKQF